MPVLAIACVSKTRIPAHLKKCAGDPHRPIPDALGPPWTPRRLGSPFIALRPSEASAANLAYSLWDGGSRKERAGTKFRRGYNKLSS